MSTFRICLHFSLLLSLSLFSPFPSLLFPNFPLDFFYRGALCPPLPPFGYAAGTNTILFPKFWEVYTNFESHKCWAGSYQTFWPVLYVLPLKLSLLALAGPPGFRGFQITDLYTWITGSHVNYLSANEAIGTPFWN